jgi:hypothetical protein
VKAVGTDVEFVVAKNVGIDDGTLVNSAVGSLVLVVEENAFKDGVLVEFIFTITNG